MVLTRIFAEPEFPWSTGCTHASPCSEAELPLFFHFLLSFTQACPCFPGLVQGEASKAAHLIRQETELCISVLCGQNLSKFRVTLGSFPSAGPGEVGAEGFGHLSRSVFAAFAQFLRTGPSRICTLSASRATLGALQSLRTRPLT